MRGRRWTCGGPPPCRPCRGEGRAGDPAPSIRWNATRCPPASTTATEIRAPSRAGLPHRGLTHAQREFEIHRAPHTVQGIRTGRPTPYRRRPDDAKSHINLTPCVPVRRTGRVRDPSARRKPQAGRTFPFGRRSQGRRGRAAEAGDDEARGVAEAEMTRSGAPRFAVGQGSGRRGQGCQDPEDRGQGPSRPEGSRSTGDEITIPAAVTLSGVASTFGYDPVIGEIVEVSI